MNFLIVKVNNLKYLNCYLKFGITDLIFNIISSQRVTILNLM